MSTLVEIRKNMRTTLSYPPEKGNVRTTITYRNGDVVVHQPVGWGEKTAKRAGKNLKITRLLRKRPL